MSNPIEGFDNAAPAPKFDPYTGKPIEDAQAPQPAQGSNFWAEQAMAAQPVAGAPVNPYAPTGWAARKRVEVDVTLPSGQLCRIMRLEREDLFRMNLLQYMDTFTPMLMEETISSDERGRRIRERMSQDPNAIANMFMAIDQVVMSATVRPRVTDDPQKKDYGGPNDWANPNFIATAFIEDIDMDDRFAIFAHAFGRSMDDLKSLFEQTPSVAGVANQPSVQPTAE